MAGANILIAVGGHLYLYYLALSMACVSIAVGDQWYLCYLALSMAGANIAMGEGQCIPYYLTV